MRHFLFDVNTVVDICAKREPYCHAALDALEKIKSEGLVPWLYVGSVQNMQYTLASELLRLGRVQERTASTPAALKKAGHLLERFAREVSWLAALSGEGHVFHADDPEYEQLIRAVDRFPEDSMKILTRDRKMLDAYPEKTISPEQYCEQLSRGGKLSFIDLARQQEDLRPELEENIHKVLHHGRYIMGPEIRELEERLSDFAGVKYAVGCSSGTDALLMPLMAWNVGPGDAVFTTPFTFIATAEVISLIGATPVFVDIDPDTYNIDPFELRRIIDLVKREGSLTPRVIIPVDLFGLPADYDAIMEIAQAEGLLVLEDAAQSFGASYKGRKAGSLGHAAATSFFPAKPLGCYGDGGAVFTDDRELAAKLNSIRIHGKGTDKYENVRIGLNARLDTMQAAVLLPKLSVFPEEIRVRQRIAELYSEGLKDRVRVPHVPEDMVSAWAQYSVLAEGPEERSAMQTRLKAAGVPTAIYYPLPLHLQGAFSKLGYSREDFPVSEQISQRIFSLPMHPYLRDEEIEFIVGALKCR